jgi:hypothetical protein
MTADKTMTTTDDLSIPFSDVALSRRLERAEGQGCADYVESRAKLYPESDACWIEVAGAYAMYDGLRSPLTQTFGLGVFEPVGHSELDRIEEFYRERGAPVFHEVSPLADPALLALFAERGYHPIELTSVLFRPIRPGINFTKSSNDTMRVRLSREDEHELWARTATKGWSEFTEVADQIFDLSMVGAKRPGAASFFAELDGKPIATGALSMTGGVAVLAGASTIPEARNNGAQLALLDARLRYAAEQGCDLAMMGALPGSASQRNAERQGFRIAYTRIKWRLGASKPAT